MWKSDKDKNVYLKALLREITTIPSSTVNNNYLKNNGEIWNYWFQYVNYMNRNSIFYIFIAKYACFGYLHNLKALGDSITSFAVLHGSRQALKCSFSTICLSQFSDWWSFLCWIMGYVVFTRNSTVEHDYFKKKLK